MTDETKDDGQQDLPGTERPAEVLLQTHMDLPVPLSVPELNQRGDELASALGELESHTAHTKQVQAELNATKKEIEARVQKLGLVLREKKESRRVLVRHMAFWSEGVVRVVRTDNGDTVRSRPLEQHEKQREIPGASAPSGGGKLIPIDGGAGSDPATTDVPPARTATGECLGHSGRLNPEEQLAEHEQKCLGKSVVQAAQDEKAIEAGKAAAAEPLKATIKEREDVKGKVDAALRGGKDGDE